MANYRAFLEYLDGEQDYFSLLFLTTGKEGVNVRMKLVKRRDDVWTLAQIFFFFFFFINTCIFLSVTREEMRIFSRTIFKDLKKKKNNLLIANTDSSWKIVSRTFVSRVIPSIRVIRRDVKTKFLWKELSGMYRQISRSRNREKDTWKNRDRDDGSFLNFRILIEDKRIWFSQREHTRNDISRRGRIPYRK